MEAELFAGIAPRLIEFACRKSGRVGLPAAPASFTTMAAPLAPIMMVAAFVFPPIKAGMIEYSDPLFAPDWGWEHQKGVSGQRLPDIDLELKDGSGTTLCHLLENGRWVRLQLAPDAEPMLESAPVSVVNLAPSGNKGPFANFASVLVRPDGDVPAEGFVLLRPDRL